MTTPVGSIEATLRALFEDGTQAVPALETETQAETTCRVTAARQLSQAAAVLDGASHGDAEAASSAIERLNQCVYQSKFEEGVLAAMEVLAASPNLVLAAEQCSSDPRLVAPAAEDGSEHGTGTGARAGARAGTVTGPGAVAGAGGVNADELGVDATTLEKLRNSLGKMVAHFLQRLQGCEPQVDALAGDRKQVLAALFALLSPQALWPHYVARRQADLRGATSVKPRSIGSLRKLGATIIQMVTSEVDMLIGDAGVAEHGLHFAGFHGVRDCLRDLYTNVYTTEAQYVVPHACSVGHALQLNAAEQMRTGSHMVLWLGLLLRLLVCSVFGLHSPVSQKSGGVSSSTIRRRRACIGKHPPRSYQ